MYPFLNERPDNIGRYLAPSMIKHELLAAALNTKLFVLLEVASPL